MASINIVLKAIDQYSSTITGLNQGFELVGKAIAGVKAVADFAWSAIKTGAETAFKGVEEAVKLARLGGAFDEQRNQFENLAKSYGIVGQTIIDTVKTTSANTLSEFDSIVIGTKAIAAGLQGQELNDALAYVKKWSESTGESFASVAEKVFTSLSSGRYSVLRQMGLVIENGAKFDDVTKAMSEGLKRFGDTGFNTADKLDALTASQDDFWRKIGQGINQSKEFQSLLGGFSDSVVELIKNFDAKPVTIFVDSVGKLIKGTLADALSAMPESWKVWEKVFEGSQSSSRTWGVAMIDVIFAVVKAAAKATNDILDILSNAGIPQILSGIATAAITIVRGVLVSIPEAIASVIELNIRTISEYYGKLVSMVEGSSILSRLFSAEEAQQARDLIKWLDDTAASVGKSADALGSIDKIFTTATDAVNKAGVAIADSRINLDGLTESHAAFRTDVYRSLDGSIKQTYQQTAETLTQAASNYRGVIDLTKTDEKLDINSLFSADSFGGLNAELDQLIDKAKAPVESTSTGLQEAARRTTQPQGIEAVTSGLNTNAVLLSLGNWLLSHIVDRASTERVPMAVLATS